MWDDDFAAFEDDGVGREVAQRSTEDSSAGGRGSHRGHRKDPLLGGLQDDSIVAEPVLDKAGEALESLRI